MDFKSMISRCIERMRQKQCATCDNRAFCPAGRWQQLFAEPGRPVPRAAAPSPLFALLGEFSRRMASAGEPPSPFRRTVERCLEPLLATGEASIDRVARKLGVSRQTLYRRLKAEGVTFEALLDALRHRTALKLLRDDHLSVKQASWRLGFSEPAAFSRAFKRWTGASPGAMRVGAPSGLAA